MYWLFEESMVNNNLDLHLLTIYLASSSSKVGQRCVKNKCQQIINQFWGHLCMKIVYLCVYSCLYTLQWCN